MENKEYSIGTILRLKKNIHVADMIGLLLDLEQILR